LIPIRDINPRLRFPIVNYLLIGASIAVFLFELGLGPDVEAFVDTFSFKPVHLYDAIASRRGDDFVAVGQQILTSMFLHGGWFHVIGNVLYLRVFGDNVEDRFGHFGYLVFYLASGVAGALGQFYFDPTSSMPMIGASGAIAGVLGAYIVMFPKARILTLFPVFIFLTFIEVPAFAFLGIWALQQLLNGFLSIAASQYSAQATGGVAWFAHIGGFLLGLLGGLVGRVLPSARRRAGGAG
jgi:membrane associated rhomboid family serine protease